MSALLAFYNYEPNKLVARLKAVPKANGGSFQQLRSCVRHWMGDTRLINAGLAQGKNRSGLLWFLLSLLLGPIATFIIVLLPKG